MSNTIKFSDLPILESLNDTDKLVIGQHNGQFATLPASKLPKPEGGGDEPLILYGEMLFDGDEMLVKAEMWKFITAIKANKNRRVFIAPSDDSYSYNTMRSVDFNLSDRYFELYISQIIASGEPVGPDNICDLYCSAITISGEYTDTDVTSISISNGQVKLLDMEHALEVTSPAEIDHFRIINKNGQSQKASIAQVRELMGIDYSKLEEQIVHGEYWMDDNGNRKQVYCRTFQLFKVVENNDAIQFYLRTNIGATNLLEGRGSVITTFIVDNIKRVYTIHHYENEFVSYTNSSVTGYLDITVKLPANTSKIGTTSALNINVKYTK